MTPQFARIPVPKRKHCAAPCSGGRAARTPSRRMRPSTVSLPRMREWRKGRERGQRERT